MFDIIWIYLVDDLAPVDGSSRLLHFAMIPCTRVRFRQKTCLVCKNSSRVENLDMESVNLHISAFTSSLKNLLSRGSHPQDFVQTLKNSSDHTNHMPHLSVDGSERELDSLTTGKEKGS